MGTRDGNKEKTIVSNPSQRYKKSMNVREENRKKETKTKKNQSGSVAELLFTDVVMVTRSKQQR